MDQSIVIDMERVSATTAVKNIDAVLDNKLDMSSHVINVCKSCYVHIRNLGKFRPFLSVDTASELVHAFISYKLDYHNALLYGIFDQLLNQLQRIQNTAARIVTAKRGSDHITPILCKLHWLPVKFLVRYKLCLLTYKGLNNLAPEYICTVCECSVLSALREKTMSCSPDTAWSEQEPEFSVVLDPGAGTVCLHIFAAQIS